MASRTASTAATGSSANQARATPSATDKINSDTKGKAAAARDNASSDSSEDNDAEDLDEEDDDDDQTWDDFDEDEDEADAKRPTLALFGEQVTLESPEAVLRHAKEQHEIDVVALISQLNLDYMQIIRLVNYIRVAKPSREVLYNLTASSPELNDDQFMIPAVADDPLLQMDLEDLALLHQPSSSTSQPSAQSNNLQRRVNELEQALQLAQVQLASRQESLEKLFQEKFGSVQSDSSHGTVDNKSKGKIKDDAGYFDSYSGNEIHELMLKDTIRTESYRQFITSNSALFKGATVLDVGCGTGILSMFAAQAGAKKVFAVDASKVAFKAMRNVKENGWSEVVEVIHAKIEDLDEEKIGKVDVIISEWMGYFLLYEAMLDSVIVARDRFLKPGGLVAPSQCSIILSAVSDEAVYNDTVRYWDDIYGFKMSAMKEEVYKEADVRVMDGRSVASTTQTIKDVNINRDQVKDCDFKTEFELTLTKSGTIHGFLGWFDTFFTRDSRLVNSESALHKPTPESHEVFFSTGPFTKATHWKQTFFLLKEPLQGLKEGDKIKGSFSCRKDVEYARGLEVEIVFGVNDAKWDRTQVWLVS